MVRGQITLRAADRYHDIAAADSPGVLGFVERKIAERGLLSSFGSTKGLGRRLGAQHRGVRNTIDRTERISAPAAAIHTRKARI